MDIEPKNTSINLLQLQESFLPNEKKSISTY